MPGRRRRAAFIAGAMLLAGWTVAEAHTRLLTSEPTDGARLEASPTRIRLTFSGPVEGRLGELSIIDPAGVATRLAAAAEPGNARAIVAPLGTLAPGGYRIAWRVVAADGHPVEGSFVFHVESVGADSVPPPPPPVGGGVAAAGGAAVGGAPIVPALLRGFAVGSLMAAAGLLLFVAMSRGDAPAARPLRVAGWMAAAAVILLVAHGAAWVANISPGGRLDPAGIGPALGTTAGRVELARIGLAALALWALALARRSALALTFAAGAVLLSGAVGHSASIQPMLAVPWKALHLVAASAWLGGLLMLIVGDSGDPLRFVREAGRVSSIALWAVVLVAVSGVAQTLLFLPAPADVFRSTYGTVVLAKIAALAALVAFGAYHRYRVLPRLGEGRSPAQLRASVSREVLVMVAVTLLGGLLAYVPPPTADAGGEPAVVSTR